jgi:arabinose-5-phosphate isomerase
MLKELFIKQKEHLLHFFENIDIEKSDKLVQKILSCTGTLIFTGVGKSGIIANKLAMTLLSTGTKAIFLPSMDALHGDIGLVYKEDMVFLLSKSGETGELLSLLPFLKKKGAFTVALVSNEFSKLAKKADFFIHLPLIKELCPFNLSPTTSTTLQLVFGDVLAVALMKNKNFTIDEYAKNHPAGAIGKQIALFAKDLMYREEILPLCNEDDQLIDVLDILSSRKCGCLIVVDRENRLKGIFTDGDLRRSIEKHKSDFLYRKIKTIMTLNPKTTTPDILAVDVMRKMEEDDKLITVMPIVENNITKKVVGIIRMHDIIQAGLNS